MKPLNSEMRNKRLRITYESRITTANQLEDLLGRYRLSGKHSQDRLSIKVERGVLVKHSYINNKKLGEE